VTLLEAIAEFGFDCCIAARGATRRKRGQGAGVFVSRRIRPVGPEEPAPGAVGSLQCAHFQGENIRAFPISNWTELDVWQYIAREKLELPPIYFAHRRSIVRRGGAWSR